MGIAASVESASASGRVVRPWACMGGVRALGGTQTMVAVAVIHGIGPESATVAAVAWPRQRPAAAPGRA